MCVATCVNSIRRILFQSDLGPVKFSATCEVPCKFKPPPFSVWMGVRTSSQVSFYHHYIQVIQYLMRRNNISLGPWCYI